MLKRNKSLLLGAIVALVVISLVIVGFFIMRGSKDDKTGTTTESVPSTTTSERSTNSVGSMRRESTNVERKNDALKVAAAVNEFMNNNNGDMPTDWTAGRLTGGAGSYPAAFTLTSYSALTVTSGSQPVNNGSTLKLVTGAVCSTDGSVKASTSKRDYAIQYGHELSNGKFEGKCVGN